MASNIKKRRSTGMVKDRCQGVRRGRGSNLVSFGPLYIYRLTNPKYSKTQIAIFGPFSQINSAMGQLSKIQYGGERVKRVRDGRHWCII